MSLELYIKTLVDKVFLSLQENQPPWGSCLVFQGSGTMSRAPLSVPRNSIWEKLFYIILRIHITSAPQSNFKNASWGGKLIIFICCEYFSMSLNKELVNYNNNNPDLYWNHDLILSFESLFFPCHHCASPLLRK